MKQLLPLLAAPLLAIVIAGCGSSSSEGDGDGDVSEGALAGAGSTSCQASSKTPCTPALGSPVRKAINDQFRFGVQTELMNAGARVDDKEIVFVYEHLQLVDMHVFVSAKIQSKTIVSPDGKTLVLPGTKFHGKPNLAHGLLELESGSNTVTIVGQPLEATMCWWLEHENYDQNLFPEISNERRCSGDAP